MNKILRTDNGKEFTDSKFKKFTPITVLTINSPFHTILNK